MVKAKDILLEELGKKRFNELKENGAMLSLIEWAMVQYHEKKQAFDLGGVVSTSVCDEPDEPVERCKCCKSFHEPDVCCYD